MVRNGHGHLVHETLKSPVLKVYEFMNSAEFLHAGSEAVIFGQTGIMLYSFDF